MAVGAHELAFGEFVEDQRLVVSAIDKRADLGDLLRPRKMIPLHRRWMEAQTAIGTGLSGLERLAPCCVVGLPAFLLRSPDVASASVVFAVVLLSASLAPRLLSVPARTMEVIGRLPPAAAAT